MDCVGESLWSRGWAALHAGNAQEAESCLTAFADRKDAPLKWRVLALLNLGQIYMNIGRSQRAGDRVSSAGLELLRKAEGYYRRGFAMADEARPQETEPPQYREALKSCYEWWVKVAAVLGIRVPDRRR